MADECPFMRIPGEIRLMIYDLLFDDRNQQVLQIRNEDPDVYKTRLPHRRTTYRTLGRDLLRQSKSTTYHLINHVEIHTSIMAVNRQIYNESSHMLYSNRAFDFDRDIEAIVPFFSDLTKHTRTLIHEVSLTKQGSVYSRDYDRCEWSAVCEFLRENMQLRSMKLTVEGGRPSLGWDGLPEYTVSDFKTLESVGYEPLEWVWQLLSVKGLQNVEIDSEINHCPPSHSSAMAFFAAFSASIETGFADYIRGELVKC